MTFLLDLLGLIAFPAILYIFVKGFIFFWKTVFGLGKAALDGEFKSDTKTGAGKELGDMAKSAIKHSFLFFK